jgi:hypothetical protein
MSTPQLIKDATAQLADWASKIQADLDPFPAAQQLVTRLGAHWRNGHAEFGFWVPELSEQEIPPENIWLEILTPLDTIDFHATEQQLDFRRHLLRLQPVGGYLWGAVSGLTPGSRTQVGDFYRLKVQTPAGEWRTIIDPLAYSVPFGNNAPAELYDIEQMQAARTDKDYFARLDTRPDPDGVPRIRGPVNVLQLHVNTASAGGTLAGLTEIYRTIAQKIEAAQPLTPTEQNYTGYESVQLMPIEPTIEFAAGPHFWQSQADDPTAETVTVKLLRPTMTNWGYDIMTAASPAPNPTALATKRPDELIDFIATLHNFPGNAIKVVLDVVYGHADNQALALLNEHYFAGANMYGQNLNYRHPVVRAVLLEMQRRKSDFGVDGVRVDGAQDFKWYDPATNTLHHDNDYLILMNNIEQSVAGVRYRPWMVFEDGRPWPRDDWELASSYREVTKIQPNVVQWGPLTFAHNTPFLFTFWAMKWWRVREIMEVGSHWITGCANHDTLRRGTQVPIDARLNTYLGHTLPEIFRNAYDNPANNLFTYAISPGVPMDFINALMRAPWSFIRNVDDRYGVKVVSEEALFLHWAVTQEIFDRPFAFRRLKALGFTDLAELRRFLHALDQVVKLTEYNLEAMTLLLNNVEPTLPGPVFTEDILKKIARSWMDDVHDYCNVSRWQDLVDAGRSQFNLAARRFRQQRPWLRQNLTDNDVFDYLHPTEGAIIYYGLRTAPENNEQLLFVANMEGAPRTITPALLPIPNLPVDGWQSALATPGLQIKAVDQPLTLHNSQGVVFARRIVST